MVAVVVGRFQVPKLHKGHQNLLGFAGTERFTSALVFLGVAPQPDARNPLPFEARQEVLREFYREVGLTMPVILPLQDQPDNDEQWVTNLDYVVNSLYGKDATMVGGRDSFLSTYTHNKGLYKVSRVQTAYDSGTRVRAEITPKWTNVDFREGYIHAWQQR